MKRDLEKRTGARERFLPLFPEIHLSSLPNSNLSTLRRQLHWNHRGLSAFVEGGRVSRKEVRGAWFSEIRGKEVVPVGICGMRENGEVRPFLMEPIWGELR